MAQAFERAAALPPDVQDELGGLFIAEIESEVRWQRAFDQSQDELARMGREALEEYHAGRTKQMGWDEL